MTQAGPAIPVTLVTDRYADGGPALRVAVVTDGRPVEGGPARPVIVVSDGRPTQGNEPVPIVVAPGARGARPLGGPALPIVIVSGSLALLSGLISYWKLEEASGTRADAVVASANDLTDNNTVTQNPGKVGNAAQFTAANSESLSRASNASLQSGDIDFTIAAWVYLDSKSARRPFVSKFNAAGQREYLLEYFNSSDRFRFVVSNDGSASVALVANTAGSPATATWYFVVGWHDSVNNTLNVQVNDGPVDSVAHSAGVFVGTETFRIGSGAGFFMDGRVDEVGFWKKVLSTAERSALYNGGNGRTYPFAGT